MTTDPVAMLTVRAVGACLDRYRTAARAEDLAGARGALGEAIRVLESDYVALDTDERFTDWLGKSVDATLVAAWMVNEWAEGAEDLFMRAVALRQRWTAR